MIVFSLQKKNKIKKKGGIEYGLETVNQKTYHLKNCWAFIPNVKYLVEQTTWSI
jgi:hypothetical protein